MFTCGQIEEKAIRIEEDLILRFGNGLGDIPGRFDSSEFKKRRPGLFHCLADQFGAFGFSFGLDNDRLLFFACAVHDENGALSFLLGDLFGLDGVGKFVRKLNCRERDIIEDNVKLLGAFEETLTDESADLFALGDELRGVKLRHDTVEDFIDDGGKDPFIEIRPEIPVNIRELLLIRFRENSDCNVNHLQVLRSGEGNNVARLGPDVEEDWAFDEGDEEVGPFGVDLVLDTGDS